jgi:hypothetical protein
MRLVQDFAQLAVTPAGQAAVAKPCGGIYTADGAKLAREMLPAHGWSEQRIARCADAIARHWLKNLSAAVPRRGLVTELAREVGRALGERPLTMPRIFWRS